MDKKNKSNISPLSYLLVAVVLITLYLGFRYYRLNNLNNFKNKIIPDAIKEVVNDPQVKFSIGSVNEASGVYKFTLTVNGQNYTSYITKDGKMLFPSAVKLDQPIKINPGSPTTKKTSPSPTPTKKK